MDPNTLKLLMGSAGAGAVADKLYIEDVFSTYLYTGNGSTQTITNEIDLSGKGGLVWIKNRTGGAGPNAIYDTARGVGGFLKTESTSSVQTIQAAISSFNSNGFSLNSGAEGGNENTFKYVSWTFRKAAKFFDVVTYTGDGTAGKTVSHNLGSVPGCIIIKRVDQPSGWPVYHRSNTAAPQTDFLSLSTTDATSDSDLIWNDTDPTSSVFTVGIANSVNANGSTYVAYLFAHDAGGFGDSGNDNVISCGSYTGNGSTSGPTVTLGWEPQWLLVKRSNSTGDWNLIDNLRGFVVGGGDAELNPNLSDSESSGTFISPLATGFQLNTTDAGYNASGGTYIYIAIRRGPMKTPTDATKVFTSVTNQNNFTNGVVTTGFPVDMHISIPSKDQNGDNHTVEDRLRGLGNSNSVGQSPNLKVDLTSAEVTDQNPWFYSAWNTTIVRGSNGTGTSPISWFFRRAPGFFDVVAYTGTGSVSTVSHNLGVAPELMIVKCRSIASNWAAYDAANGPTNLLTPNSTDASAVTAGSWNNTAPSSTQFTVGTISRVNSLSERYIAYLFATCPGVSKVGSYTGSGTTKQIDCGFTNGARFVLIKRTDSTGNWYVWDTARGIVSGNDPFLFLNSTAAENTSTDYIDPLSTGFEISSTAPAAINANGGTFIYLAIA